MEESDKPFIDEVWINPDYVKMIENQNKALRAEKKRLNIEIKKFRDYIIEIGTCANEFVDFIDENKAEFNKLKNKLKKEVG